MIQFPFPLDEFVLVIAAQHERAVMALQLQRDAIVFLRKNLMHAYLVEVDDAFWSFLISVVLLCLVIFQHIVLQ